MNANGAGSGVLAPALLTPDSWRPMELFFKKYFWTVTLLFLLLVAFLAARTVNSFIEWRLAPGPMAGIVGKGRAAPAVVAPPAQPKLDRLAKALGLPVPQLMPDVKEPEQEQLVDLNAAPVKSSLRVRLLGTLVSALPAWSIASIQDAVTQKTETFMVGDRIQNAEILEIEREQVIILNGTRREYINNEAGDGSGPPPPVAAAVTPPSSNNLGTGIRALSDNEYEVPRGEIDKTLSNLNDVAMQARIVPAFKDGQAHGFKLFSIRPDSIYSKIGVQNGDVIRRINGYDLNSPEKALEVYSKLKEAGRIEIELERNGSVLRKTYTIR